MKVAIAIKIGSPETTLELVQTTIKSIMTNIGTDDYKIIINMSPFINKSIKDYIRYLQEEKGNLIDLMPTKDVNMYWADFINEAIDRAEGCEYFIKSHDDIDLLTPNFISIVEDKLKHITEPVGWVSFTDKDYLNGNWAPSTRVGWHKDYLFEDAWSKRTMFQFHNLPDNWFKSSFLRNCIYKLEIKIRGLFKLKACASPKHSKEYYADLPYDMPIAPVKCHSPFNHFVLISMEKLKEIGKCENWKTYNALLVDEDWGLRALQLGLNNIWIPDIDYVHCRPDHGGTRSWDDIVADKERVHKLFSKKWDFNYPSTIEELDFIKEKYKNTNIVWSFDKNSYDWEYIK